MWQGISWVCARQWAMNELKKLHHYSSKETILIEGKVIVPDEWGMAFSGALTCGKDFSFTTRDAFEFFTFCREHGRMFDLSSGFMAKVYDRGLELDWSKECDQDVDAKILNVGDSVLFTNLTGMLSPHYAFGFFGGLSLIMEILLSIWNESELFIEGLSNMYSLKTFMVKIGAEYEVVHICIDPVRNSKRWVVCMDDEIDTLNDNECGILEDQLFINVTTEP